MAWRKFGAALIAALLIFAAPSAAYAHTSSVTGTAVCEADGTYTVTWTYKAINVPNGVEAETKAMTTNKGSLAVIDGVNKGGQIFLSVWGEHQINVPGAPARTGNWSATFKTVGIPGDYRGEVTTMVQTDWKGGPSEDPVGKVTVDGSCSTPDPEPEEEPSPSPTPTTPPTTPPSPEPSPEPSSGPETPTPEPTSTPPTTPTPEPSPSVPTTPTQPEPQPSSSPSPTSAPTSSTPPVVAPQEPEASQKVATPTHEELAATGFRSLMVVFGAAMVLIVGGALIRKGYPPKP